MNPSQKIIKSAIKAAIIIVFLLIAKAVLNQFNFNSEIMFYLGIAIKLLIIALILNLSKEIKKPIELLYPKLPEISIVIVQIVFLIVIIVVYNTFLPIVYKYALEFRWLYQLICGILALVPIYKIGKLLYDNLDRISMSVSSKTVENLKQDTKEN